MSRWKKALCAIPVVVVLALAAWTAPGWYYRQTLFNAGGNVNDEALIYFHSLGPSEARPALQDALQGYKLAALQGDDFWFYSRSTKSLTHYVLAPTHVFIDGIGGEVRGGWRTVQGRSPWSNCVGPVALPADWNVQKLSYNAASRLQIEYISMPTARRWMATLKGPSWAGFSGDWELKPL